MLRNLLDTVDKGIDMVNIFTTDMCPKKEDMIDVLLEKGYTEKEILDLIDVVRTQAESYVKTEIGYRERDIRKAEKDKIRSKSSA